jgi:ATP-dependent DNA helicase RecQ
VRSFLSRLHSTLQLERTFAVPVGRLAAYIEMRNARNGPASSFAVSMLDATRPQAPLEALRRFFGYDEFRPGQEEIIRTAIAGDDTLVVMPTGGGKSLCYQIPAIILEGVTIVVSPLIALMKDQVDTLERKGIRATTINSTLEFAELRQRMTDIRYGLYRLVYVAPERFESQTFLELMREVPIALFAVDEAHCISEWGHDFRPSYLKIAAAIEELGRPPVIALTATATPYVQQDVIQQLGLRDPKRFVRGFDRPNLSYRVLESSDKDADLREIMAGEMRRDGATIIYCGTRRAVESVGTMLHAEGLPVSVYHAGMHDDYRRAAQESFIDGRAKIIVATNAFGMGIDKADVRHVIHYDMPGSIEAYYQEAGRAGRDGRPSDCTLLFNGRDRRLQEFFIRSSFPDRSEIDAVYSALWDALHVAVGSRYEGVFVPDERDIVGRARIHGATLNGALAILEKNGIVRKLRAERIGMVRFLASSREIQEYYQRTRDEERKKTIVALLRTLGGAALTHETFINPVEVAARHGLTVDAFERSMRALVMAGIFRYTPPTPGTGYQLLQERLDPRRVRIDDKAIEIGRSRALMKLDTIERYVNERGCRRDFILEYFCAEHAEANCGRCDNCRRAPVERADEPALRPHVKRAAEQLMAAVAELGGRFGKMTVVDLLRGVRTATTTQFSLDRYRRFGELREVDRVELARIADDLCAAGLLERTTSLKPLLRMTPAGRAAIAHLSLERFVLPVQPQETSENPTILALLRTQREQIARQEGLAPASVCGDQLLTRISNELPTNRSRFLAIDGASEDVYRRCGAQFVACIEAALVEQQWTEEGGEIPDRLRRTWMLLSDGCTMEEIARRSALQPATVSSHIEELIRSGVDVDVRRLVPEELVASVGRELERAPRATLRELRASLGGAVGYPELRIAVAHARAAAGGTTDDIPTD